MSQSKISFNSSQVIPWRGFHHIALVTRDLDATIRFYQNILGMQGSDIIRHPQRGRHCFIKPGLSETENWGLHFFEESAAQILVGPDTPITFGFMPGAVQHIAFALPDEADALALRERLQAHDVVMTEIIDLGPSSSILFRDNNGVLLEATWPKT